MTDRDIIRKLTTIFAADVVGYSRLMSVDEEATLRTLKDHRRIIDGEIDEHGGRIFATGGDSVLAEFASTVEALHCAVTIQDQLRIRNRRLPADKRMEFRIGINVGDVMVDKDDLLGDGVNIAARLESIADPGGILISGSAYALVNGKLPYEIEDAGARSVKNIAEPVPTYRIRLDGGAADTGAATPAPPPSTETAPAEPARAGARRRLAWYSAMALVIALAAGAGALTFLIPRGAESELIGMTAYGTARTSGYPFELKLDANGKAEMELVLNANGATLLDPGRWWMPRDEQICFQFGRFGAGREICRTLARDGDGFIASARDDKDDRWSIDRSLVRTGMTVHGMSPTTGGPFVISLEAAGAASVEIETDQPEIRRRDQGKWWTNGEQQFCFQFTRFSQGQQRCRPIVKQEGRLMAVLGGNRDQDWEIRR